MKNVGKMLIAFCLFFYGTAIQAQETVPASGGNASGSGGSSSYSIGQTVYSIDAATIGSMSKGVQQPYEFITLSTEDNEGISLQCLVYPNPTNDFIKLIVENHKLGNLRFELYDLSGKLLQNENVTKNETLISMKDLTPAIYFLKVTDKNKAVKTIKIIKNN